MADGEELKSDILSSNTLISWERFQLPSLPNQFQFQSPVLVLSDPLSDGGIWSTPAVHKEHRTSVVFPPTNHEGLNLHHQLEVKESYNENAKPSLPVSSELKPAVMEGPVTVKWRFLHFKVPSIVSCIWNFSVIRGGLLRSVNFPLIGSTVLLLLFYFRFCLRRRRQRRSRVETVDGLLGVIKEKDERIHQLLQQIARMNELLLATHHRVPSISKAASS